MLKVLIADGGEFGKELRKQLSDAFDIELCADGPKTLKKLVSNPPDIFVLNLRLSGGDGLDILQTYRTAGGTAKVFAVCDYTGDYVLSRLEMLQVSAVFTVPCTMSSIAADIREAGFQLLYGERDDWRMDMELDRILLSLGFTMGRTRYCCVFDAVCVKCNDLESTVTKGVYPQVAMHMCGNPSQVEKAIRNAIRAAWDVGDRTVWRMYFAPESQRELSCPTNDEFITRIARLMYLRWHREEPPAPVRKKA